MYICNYLEQTINIWDWDLIISQPSFQGCPWLALRVAMVQRRLSIEPLETGAEEWVFVLSMAASGIQDR